MSELSAWRCFAWHVETPYRMQNVYITMGPTHAHVWLRLIGRLYIRVGKKPHHGAYWKGIQ